MRRLTLYLARLFATDALILFGVVGFLLWLVQCLRVFDVVSVKGQSLFTLALQGVLTMPPLVLAFAFVCVGIGLSRALVALAASRELHIVHSAGGLTSLMRATALVGAGGGAVILVIAHLFAPMAERQLQVLNAGITADLVGATLKPGRFTQAMPGVVLLIGARSGSGEITEFFADDRRDPAARRTYWAEAGRIFETGDGYVLQLTDGALQTLGADGRFSEVRFERYEVNIDQFAQAAGEPNPVSGTDSIRLVAEAIAAGAIEEPALRALVQRSAEGVKALGMAVLVLALSGFPGGGRTRAALPMEAVVLFIAFLELAISSYGLFRPLLGETLAPLGGSLLMIVTGLIILIVRMRGAGRRRAAA